MRVSVLIVSFEVRELLARCLASLGDAGETIVVDNASSDGSAAMVRERHRSVRLIPLPENRGFSAAVNLAAREASGDAFLVLNPDAALPPGALPRMIASLERRPGAWMIGFRQEDGSGRFQIAFGPGPSFALELARRIIQRGIDRGSGRLAGALDRLISRPIRVPWVSGSSVLVRRSAFERVGGFDERYFLYFEDADLCLRARSAGGEVWYDPTVTILHERGASVSTNPQRARRAYRESQALYWETHRGAWARRIVQSGLRLRGELPGPR
jgi:N-acetylglucosaminyl-diphospho-decaprenol L-rhamnosyltransferase